MKTLFALGCSVSSLAIAQIRPDAGQVLRETARPPPPMPPPSPQAPPIMVPEDLPTSQSSDEARITVNRFMVTGNTIFSSPALGLLLNPWKGRALTLPELQAAAERITRHYREHGYLIARAYLPAQTMHDGVLEIAVLEGRIGRLILENSSRVSDRQARHLAGKIKVGDLVRESELEPALVTLNATPGIGTAQLALQPGASVGLSDLVVALRPGPLMSGAVDVNNFGNQYTGKYLAGGTLNVNSPFHLGDQITARVQASNDALYYARLAYRVPISADGLVAGAALSSSRYQLGRDFEMLDANGSAGIASVFAAYPLVRSRTLSISAALTLDHKGLHDRIDSLGTAVNKKIKLVSAGFSGDAYGRNGACSFALGHTTGILNIDTPEALITDSASARTNGRYSKFVYSVRGVFSLTPVWSITTSVNGQLAGKNLDSSERFSLGGADSLRAYPQAEATGDEGYVATAELIYGLPVTSQATISGFIDTGKVKINRVPYIDGDNHRRLSGAGIGFGWMPMTDIMIKASVARKLGNASASADNGADVRTWLQAVRYF